MRFLYCYPNLLTDRLIEAVAGSPKVARYFDIPLQHASRTVLKAMRRGSGAPHFLQMLTKRFAPRSPRSRLRTTMIVGFPGETEDDFRALGISSQRPSSITSGVFTYSNEESSAAFALPGAVPSRGRGRGAGRRILAAPEADFAP